MAIIYGIPDSKRRFLKKLPNENKGSPLYRGAKGELTVLDKLSELDDNYHVLCGLRIDLGHLVTYPLRKTKDLRKAQMDFVVVSKRGIVVIEAKNWSDAYISKSIQHGGIIPHEQVDRAGLVLWIELQSWRSPKKPSVTKVVLATQGNMQYDPAYKAVYVKDLNNINYFIQNRYKQFSDEEVKRVIERLR